MKILCILGLIVILGTIILVACVPLSPGMSEGITKDNNMTYIGRIDEIQVWKFRDGTVTCYVAVNASSYQAAGIFCK